MYDRDIVNLEDDYVCLMHALFINLIKGEHFRITSKRDAQRHILFTDSQMLLKSKIMNSYFPSKTSLIISERNILREIKCFQLL